MADGSGTNLKAKASFQSDAYMFKMNSSAASSHSLGAQDSGKTYFLDSTVARTITLPAPVAGQTYKLIYGGAAEETENLIIVTPGNSNFFLGGVVHMDSDADNVSVYSDGNSNSKLTLTDFGIFEINIVAKDSTNYYIWGYQEGADAPAFADQ